MKTAIDRVRALMLLRHYSYETEKGIFIGFAIISAFTTSEIRLNDRVDAGETATRNFELNERRSYEASCFASRPMVG